MEFEWDARKRAQVLADRNLDFASARVFFDGRPACHQPSHRNDEERWKTTAMFDGGTAFTLIWCWRDDVVRVISLRRAHEQEIRTYRQIYGC